jgi:3-hydroxyacyl-[acyl-carrier-protein] dehydratase
MSNSLVEADKPVLNIKEIRDILPHRYPFLLVDKVIELDLEGNSITAQKNVTANEEFFQGHFPENPIMPGVLIIEALAQVGCILFKKKIQVDKVPVFLHLNKVKFRHPVKPGDVLILKAEGLHASSKGGRIKAKALIYPDKLACEAEIGFVLVNLNDI